MTAPKGLGNRGRELWRSIGRALPADWELDEREIELLTLACRQADDVARLETAIRRDGAMVRGSAGQPVCNPAITEARSGRLAIKSLLGELQLPDEATEPRTAAGRRGQKAARTRWARVAERSGGDHGAA